MIQRVSRTFHGPPKEVGLLDVRGGVAVSAVAVLVVEAAFPEDHLVFWDGLLAAERVEADGAAGLLVFC